MPDRLSFILAWQLLRRHWTVYRKNFSSNILPTIIDPLLFLLAFGLGIGSYMAPMEDQPYLNYLGPGLAMTTALFTAFFEASYNFYIRLSYERIYQAIMTTPLGLTEIILGEFMWFAAKGAMMSLGVGSVLALFGIVDVSLLPLLPVVGASLAMACGGIGLVATSIVRNINQFQTVYALIISPLFFLSGAFYSVADLPLWAGAMTQISPVYHAVRISQEMLWPNHIRDWQGILIHAGALSLLVAALGLAGALRIRRRIN
jgi:lipooligosaccharide transport system permease protein